MKVSWASYYFKVGLSQLCLRFPKHLLIYFFFFFYRFTRLKAQKEIKEYLQSIPYRIFSCIFAADAYRPKYGYEKWEEVQDRNWEEKGTHPFVTTEQQEMVGDTIRRKVMRELGGNNIYLDGISICLSVHFEEIFNSYIFPSFSVRSFYFGEYISLGLFPENGSHLHLRRYLYVLITYQHCKQRFPN